MADYMIRVMEIPFRNAVDAMIGALAAKGFEVVTSMDVRALMRAKVGAAIKPYTILFVCHPHLVWQALQIDAKVGPLLPVSIIVRETRKERTELAIADPVTNECDINDIRLRNIATSVRRLLDETLDQLCPEEASSR